MTQQTSGKSNLLPFVQNGIYNVTFKRFNGEVYTSKIRLPEKPVFTEPKPNTVFNKADPVHVAWQELNLDGVSQIMTALFHTPCLAQGNVNLERNSADIPAGYAASCPGVIDVWFFKGLVMPGLGYGTNMGISMSELRFSFGAPIKGLVKKLSNRDLVAKLSAARHRGQHWIDSESEHLIVNTK